MNSKADLFHYSDAFVSFLASALPKAELVTLEGPDDTRMHVAVCHDRRFGKVANSLPFFGSHGGPSPIAGAAGKRELLSKFFQWASDNNIASATVIENPFDPFDEAMIAVSGLESVDDRIGQFTKLPASDSDDLDDALFSLFHTKTRNAVRKGQKLDLEIVNSVDQADWDWMQTIHAASISSLGGVVKGQSIFAALRKSFGDDARLHVAFHKGRPIAGLLSIVYGNTIEYFTPVVDPEYRDSQALSAIIFEVMKQGSAAGLRFWNWGGTWRSQDGVYRFKNRFGAFDRPYRYFNRVFDENLLKAPREDILRAFPFFYVYRY